MKFTKITILTGSFLIMFSLYGAVEKDHFLSINANIKNEDLRRELNILKQDFDNEKQKIQDYYKREIGQLKEERQSEVKALKMEFGEKRGTLLRKYDKDRKLIYSKPSQSDKPVKKERKDNKTIRKSK